MEILLYLAGAFVVEMAFFKFLDRRMFPAITSSQFVSMRTFRDISLQQMMKRREARVLQALAVGLTCGWMACFFLDAFFLPVLGAIAAIESTWLIMTYEFRPHLRYEPALKLNLLAGSGAALILGVVLSVMAASSPIPIAVVLVSFWLAWALLKP